MNTQIWFVEIDSIEIGTESFGAFETREDAMETVQEFQDELTDDGESYTRGNAHKHTDERFIHDTDDVSFKPVIKLKSLQAVENGEDEVWYVDVEGETHGAFESREDAMKTVEELQNVLAEDGAEYEEDNVFDDSEAKFTVMETPAEHPAIRLKTLDSVDS